MASEYKEIKTSVQKGTMLGPLLFIVYADDIQINQCFYRKIKIFFDHGQTIIIFTTGKFSSVQGLLRALFYSNSILYQNFKANAEICSLEQGKSTFFFI